MPPAACPPCPTAGLPRSRRVLFSGLLAVAGLLTLLLYDDTINPDFQSYNTHLRILSTRMRPDSVRHVRCDNCNPMNFRTLLRPRRACEGAVEVLVLVTTVPSEVSARRGIRRTWGLHARGAAPRVRIVYLYGAGWAPRQQAVIDEESAEFGDVLQEDFKDAYYNLTYKMITGYRWAMRNCEHAQFVLRTADDNFVHVPRMLQWLRTMGRLHLRAQIGHIFTHMHVHRYRNKKWFVSYPEFPEPYYPPYAVGTAFLYSMAAVREVVNATPSIPFFALEDVWFGLLMREIDMPTVELPGFDKLLTGRHLRQLQAGRCPLGGAFFGMHLVTEETMLELWKLCPATQVKPDTSPSPSLPPPRA